MEVHDTKVEVHDTKVEVHDLTENVVLVYDLKTETVSEYHLINGDRELECNIA